MRSTHGNVSSAGEIDRSRRKLAHCGSRLELVHVWRVHRPPGAGRRGPHPAWSTPTFWMACPGYSPTDSNPTWMHRRGPGCPWRRATPPRPALGPCSQHGIHPTEPAALSTLRNDPHQRRTDPTLLTRRSRLMCGFGDPLTNDHGRFDPVAPYSLHLGPVNLDFEVF